MGSQRDGQDREDFHFHAFNMLQALCSVVLSPLILTGEIFLTHFSDVESKAGEGFNNPKKSATKWKRQHWKLASERQRTGSTRPHAPDPFQSGCPGSMRGKAYRVHNQRFLNEWMHT